MDSVHALLIRTEGKVNSLRNQWIITDEATVAPDIKPLRGSHLRDSIIYS